MERYIARQETNPVKAIREMCIECMGGRGNTGYSTLIKECVVKVCPLFAFRLGKNPYLKKRELSEAHKKALIHSRVNEIPPENPSTRINNRSQLDYL